MDSDLEQQQQQQMSKGGGGGLTRYRSAPSSYFSGLMGGAEHEQPRPLSPETESILARFMDNVSEGPHKLYDIPEYSPVFAGSVKQETDKIHHSLTPSSSQINYQPISSPTGSDFRFPSSAERGNSGLVRQRSSPAGLQDGFLVSSDTGSVASGSGGINLSSAAARRFNSGGDEDSFLNGFAGGSWDDSPIYSGGPETSGGDFNSPENQQSRQGRNNSRPAGLLAHHLSLPKGSIEKLLQFQDSVPCKMRAKRGYATHPRSIAERVRRTKISERMRKLQDLVPNMDKQTNTSDMLDLAVDYIKELQKQVETLTDKRDKCTCTSKLEISNRGCGLE